MNCEIRNKIFKKRISKVILRKCKSLLFVALLQAGMSLLIKKNLAN